MLLMLILRGTEGGRNSTKSVWLRIGKAPLKDSPSLNDSDQDHRNRNEQ